MILSKTKTRYVSAILVFVMLTITSCIQGSSNSKLSDGDIRIFLRLLSPDRKYIVYGCSYDLGAMGDAITEYSIVKASDTLGVINEYTFARLQSPPYARYTVDTWLDDTTLQVKIDVRPFLRQDIPIDTSGFKVGDIKVKVVKDNKVEGIRAIIEHYAVSKDEKSLLIAYRYTASSALNVSVIKLTDKLPSYGNVLGETFFGDDVLFGKWSNNKEITFLVDSGFQDDFQDALTELQDYTYKVVKEKYIPKYSGIVGGWYNKELYPKDSATLKVLKENQSQTKAVIADVYDYGDSYYTNLTNYSYEYTVEGKVYKSYFRATEKECRLTKGDSIQVSYNNHQPIVHRIIGHKAR